MKSIGAIGTCSTEILKIYNGGTNGRSRFSVLQMNCSVANRRTLQFVCVEKRPGSTMYVANVIPDRWTGRPVVSVELGSHSPSDTDPLYNLLRE